LGKITEKRKEYTEEEKLNDEPNEIIDVNFKFLSF